MIGLLKWLAYPGWWLQKPTRVEVSSVLEIEDALDAALGGRRSRKRVEIVFKARAVLKKRFRADGMTNSKLRNALRLKAEAMENSSGMKLLHTSRAMQSEDNDNTESLIEQLFVREDDLNTAIEAAKRRGANIVSAIAHAGDTQLSIFSEPSRHQAAMLWWTAAFSLTSGMVLLNWAETRGKVDQLSEQLSEQQSQLAETNNILSAIDESGAQQEIQTLRVDAVLKEFQSASQTLGRLSDLSIAISDSTWLTGLRFDGQTWRLNGTSTADIAEVLQEVRDVPWVQSVELATPIARDRRSGAVSFDLIVTGRDI